LINNIAWLLRRFPVFAVQTVDRNLKSLVKRMIRFDHVVLLVATCPVLRAKHSHQL
jgi:hypothetical protein